MTAENRPTAIDLAREPDFELGPLRMRPSLRQVASEKGEETLEPRIMQVLTALARRRGEVVSRDELSETCWGGRTVGEDALNRCISKVRRLGEAAGAFTLETIPRVGYRLIPAETSTAGAASVLDAPAVAAPPAAIDADRPSLAVMPFTNRSGLTEDDALAYGMVEDIISAISLSPDIRVIASSSTRAWAGKATDLRIVGRERGVRYVLEGNVRRTGPNLRVTVQLVEAETGAVLWTARFDRPLSELAALQEDLVTEVAAHLGVQVQNIEMERALKKPGDITAYEAVQRANAIYASLSLERTEVAVAEARRAVAIAPDYGAAHARLAASLAVQVYWTGGADEPLKQEALQHAGRALALAPNDPGVLTTSAFALAYLDQPREALRHAQRAVDLNPNIADSQRCLANIYVRLGRNDEAIACLDAEERLAPGNFVFYLSCSRRSRAHIQAGRLEQAVEAMERAFRLNPDYAPTLVLRAGLCGLVRRSEDASDCVRRLRALEPDTSADIHAARMLARGERTASAGLLAAFRNAWDETPAK